MKTVGDVFSTFRQQLQSHYEAGELETITLWVLNEVTGKSNAQLKAFTETVISEQQSSLIDEVLKKLLTGMPLQYAIGSTQFYGLEFQVTPAVLIPRPETEELVEWIIQETDNKTANLKILDIGTGSGCIAIALKTNLPATVVSAIDISPEALKIAKINAQTNNTQVAFIQADILEYSFAEELTAATPFSVIVSNPPYVTLADKKQMHDRVTNYEPHTALFIPEAEPLLFHKAIADFALTHLVENGSLFLEINESFGQETTVMLHNKGFKHIELRKDLYGKDRMIKAER